MATVDQETKDSTVEAFVVEDIKEWSEEEEAVLRTAFDLMDANKDDQIDFQELEMGVGQNVRKSVLARAIESVDENEDNVLNFEEFKELMKSREIDVAIEEDMKSSSEPMSEDDKELEKIMMQKLGSSMVSNDMRRSSLFGRLAVADESGKDLIRDLRSLDEELAKVPDGTKQQFLQAKEKCPQLLGDKFKIMFLRSEEYDAKRAATRLVGYWEERVRIFGREKAFLPMTQSGALRDSEAVLGSGLFKAIEKKDKNGQTLMFADFSSDKKGSFDSDEKCRAFWYVVHSLLKDEDTQLKGMVLLIKAPPNLRAFDPKMLKLIIQDSRYYLPIRFACVHVCNAPAAIKIMARVTNMFLGEFKHRRRIHRGSTEQVLAALEGFGIPNDCVPTELGGLYEVDHSTWLKDRRDAGL